MEEFKYNYVIFGSDWDLYQQAYSDVLELPNVRYVSDKVRKILVKSNPIYHLQFSKWNNYVNLPFKSYWNNKYFVDDFESTKPICFIFFEGWEKLNHVIHLTDYLRKTYIDCKIVLFLQDLFDIQKKAFTKKFLNADEEKRIYDLIISFDPKECQKYGFIYHPLVFSTFKGNLDPMPRSDIYFLGRAKDRLKTLIDVYEILKSRNLKIDFHITGVPESEQVYRNDIHYNTPMSYNENLQHVLHSKCILEIMQRNGHGFTQRTVEVLSLNKKLLTNNPIISSSAFFNPSYISVFETPQEIDINFIDKLHRDETVDYNCRDIFSPIEFLHFIEKNI